MNYFLAFLLLCLAITVFTRGRGDGVAKYARYVMYATSQFFNVLAGGHPDQSFSGRCGILREQGNWLFTQIADFLDCVFEMMGEEDHCRRAIEWDRPALADHEVSVKTLVMFLVFLTFALAFGYIADNADKITLIR